MSYIIQRWGTIGAKSVPGATCNGTVWQLALVSSARRQGLRICFDPTNLATAGTVLYVLYVPRGTPAGTVSTINTTDAQDVIAQRATAEILCDSSVDVYIRNSLNSVTTTGYSAMEIE